MSNHRRVTSIDYCKHSTLSGALPTYRPEHIFVAPQRYWLFQQAWRPANWNAQVKTSNSLLQPIYFDHRGQGGARQGVYMRTLAAQAPSVLDGPNDFVFASSGLQRIQLRIMWPGYAQLDWVRFITVAAPTGHITRAQLAIEISQQFAKFVDTARAHPSSDRNPLYAIGAKGVLYEHLVLVSLHNVIGEYWQADVAIDRPC